jgi:hypothetical protein
MEITKEAVTKLALAIIEKDVVKPEFKRYSAFHPEHFFEVTESLKQALITCYGENPDEELVYYKKDVENCKIGEYCYIMSYVTFKPMTEKEIRKIAPGAEAEHSVKFYSEKGLLEEIQDSLDYNLHAFFEDTIHQYAILAHLKLLNGTR